MKKNKVEIALQVLKEWHDEEVKKIKSSLSLMRRKSLRDIISFVEGKIK